MREKKNYINLATNKCNIQQQLTTIFIFLFSLSTFNIRAANNYSHKNELSAFQKKYQTKGIEQQNETLLKGKVLDEKNEPLIGASIYVKELASGVATDINGNFEIALPANKKSEITISYIGMKTQNYVFNGKAKTITIVLQPDQLMLSDVIVIGYGSKDKRSLTSSISSVKKDDMEKVSASASTLDNILGGMVKGVQIKQSSGEPGATANINVRGITSPYPNLLSWQVSNVPLYVIDGVPMFMETNALNPLMSISPNDIESVDILKDASATAIYGSRGANGVIIVKTKSGSKGEKLSMEFNYNFTVGNPIKEYKPLNREQFINLQDEILTNTTEAFNNQASYAGYYFNILEQFGDFDMDYMTGVLTYKGLRKDAFGKENTDWMRAIRNVNAPTHQYSFSLRGGGERSAYSLSFNGMNQEGLYINDKLQRYGVRTSLDLDITDKIKMGTVFNYSYSVRNAAAQPLEFGNEAYRTWNVRPDMPIYNEDGSFHRIDGSALYYGSENQIANPVAMRRRKSEFKNNQLGGNMYLDVRLLDNLTWHTDINISHYQFDNSYFIPVVAIDLTDYTAQESTLSIDQSSTLLTSFNTRLDYKKTIAQKHAFTGMVGLGRDRSFNKTLRMEYQGFPNDEYVHNIGSAKMNTSYNDSYRHGGLNSLYSRFTYGYDYRYLLELAIRADESSKFGPNNRWGVFTAASLGWRISSEAFMEDFNQIDDLKLRLSTGKTGSTNIPDFSYKQYFVSGGNKLYQGNLSSSLQDLLPNPNVRWEMTTDYNVGFDFSFFKRRLYGSLDVYYRYTDGALALAPHILESGIGMYYSNIIDMSNRGFEFEIGGDIIRQPNFVWSSSLNISRNRNRIEKLNSATISNFLQDSFIEGQPVGTYRGYIVKGIVQSQDEIDKLNAMAAEKDHWYYQDLFTGPGDYIYEDLNGDGHITIDDRQIIATPEVDFFGGWNNSFSYKNFSLSILTQFSKGGKAIWSTLMKGFSGNLGINVIPEVYGNTWTPQNTDARYPRLVYLASSDFNYRLNDRMVFDASYLRLKNIILSYNLTKGLDKLHVKNIQFNVMCTNLLTLTKWPGLDPEMLGSTPASMSMNDDPYPMSRSFSVGVKIGF